MIIAFIPARGGSKSIPNKNIKILGDKPLIAWTIQDALDCKFQRVIVSTDSEEIAKVAREYGAEVMMRPSELAQDTTSLFEVMKNEIPKIDPLPEFVMLLQPTTPFRKKLHITTAINLLPSQTEYDSLISVEKVPEKYNPKQIIITTSSGSRMADGSPISQRITRRQSFPEAYIPTGGIYFFRTKNLEGGNFYGEKVLLLEGEGTININTESDFIEAEQTLKQT